MSEPNETESEPKDQAATGTESATATSESAEGALEDKDLEGVAGGLRAGTIYVSTTTYGA